MCFEFGFWGVGLDPGGFEGFELLDGFAGVGNDEGVERAAAMLDGVAGGGLFTGVGARAGSCSGCLRSLGDPFESECAATAGAEVDSLPG
jgi:hypothetical protein